MRIQPYRIETMKTLDEMEVRFFGPFNFMSPVQAGHSMCDTLSLRALRFCPPRGIRCATGMVVLNKPENMNTQKGSNAKAKATRAKTDSANSVQPLSSAAGPPPIRRIRLLIDAACAARASSGQMTLNDWRDVEQEVKRRLNYECAYTQQ